MNRAYISLGSNIEPEKNLAAAVDLLADAGEIAAVSGVWQSAPVGRVDQADFLNAAVLLLTPLDAGTLRREVLVEIEQRLGRRRDPLDRNAPRTIDLDLSLFNRDVFELEGRAIPDPDILARPFVAVPLSELDAEYGHPIVGKSLGEIAAAFGDLQGKLEPRLDVRLRR